MTVKELQIDFEKQPRALGALFVFPLQKTKEDLKRGIGIMAAKEGDEIHPSTHRVTIFRPFIFDVRQVPKSFHGFELETTIISETIPYEFRLDEEDIVPFDICHSEEKIIAYAEKNALDICEQLNDYSFTLKDICDMIAGGDFERHKKLCEQLRLKRMNC